MQPVRDRGRAAVAHPWFVVLPDATATGPVVDRLPAGQVINHPSGRPFVLGCWDNATVAQARDKVTVTLGGHHLISENGRTRARGTASGLHRLFHTTMYGVTLAADRADTLARLIGSAPDPSGLVLRLLSPHAPWPLTWRSVWSDVTSVPPGHRLDLDTAAHERWWTPPAPELPLSEAGPLLRTALENAIDRRDHDLVACDLSGLDSSSLFGLAAQRGPVVGLTYEADDPGDEDVGYARHLAESFGAAHDVLAAADAPLPFQGLRDDAGPFDEPTWVSSYRARIGTTSARAAAHGASLRFAGHGGDEVLMPPPVWLADIARRHPLRAARLARRVQAKYRLSAGDLAGMVAARTTYPEWFAGCLDGRQPGEWQTMSWGIPPALPSWLTADAVELAHCAIADAAATALAAARGMHATLEAVHTGALAARHIAQLGAADGMPVALPYFDDRVLEACLAIRPEDAIDPARYKPQLVSAMTGVLPPRTLHRAGKSEISMTVGRGWATHRSELVDLVDDSRLARLGLIDAAAVRRICTGPYDAASCGPVRQFLDLESWLRTATKGSG